MTKIFEIIRKNILQTIIFVVLIILPSLVWFRFLYIIDDGYLMQITFGLLNCMLVPIETSTIVVLNVAGFCFLKRYKVWKWVSLIYSTIVMLICVGWCIWQFIIMAMTNQDHLELIFCTGPNFSRDVFYISLNNIISTLNIWIIFFSEIGNKITVKSSTV